MIFYVGVQRSVILFEIDVRLQKNINVITKLPYIKVASGLRNYWLCQRKKKQKCKKKDKKKDKA